MVSEGPGKGRQRNSTVGVGEEREKKRQNPALSTHLELLENLTRRLRNLDVLVADDVPLACTVRAVLFRFLGFAESSFHVGASASSNTTTSPTGISVRGVTSAVCMLMLVVLASLVAPHAAIGAEQHCLYDRRRKTTAPTAWCRRCSRVRRQERSSWRQCSRAWVVARAGSAGSAGSVGRTPAHDARAASGAHGSCSQLNRCGAGGGSCSRNRRRRTPGGKRSVQQRLPHPPTSGPSTGSQHLDRTSFASCSTML